MKAGDKHEKNNEQQDKDGDFVIRCAPFAESVQLREGGVPVIAADSHHSDPVLVDGLRMVYELLRARFPNAARASVALYDRDGDIIRSFIDTEVGSQQASLRHYRFPVGQCAVLKSVLSDGKPQLIEDLSKLGDNVSRHTRELVEAGYRSCYACPILDAGKPLGIVFFNSDSSGCFVPKQAQELEIYARLVAEQVTALFDRIEILQSTMQMFHQLTRFRDTETAGHLRRIARYSRIIGEQLAGAEGLSDDYIEFLYHYAPMHDIGKLGVPDPILLKAGALSAEEKVVIRAHTTRGLSMVNTLLRSLGGEVIPYAQMLRNIVYHHHESMDGSGYPEGLSGKRIPLEARIVSVADVFDALTSRRRYKSDWAVGEATEYLRKRRGTKFDTDCVNALIDNLSTVTEFREELEDR